MGNTDAAWADFANIANDLLAWAAVALVLYFALRPLYLIFYCLAVGDEKWRVHLHNYMMMSDVYAAGYVIEKVGDAVYDKTQKRADVIDQAIAEGKDPYKAVDDAGL